MYNDRFVDANDSWRHSTWCEFMYQRLMLAKDLLRQDGVIFVSIDDNEVFALGMLMNKVFGNGNWISTLIWKKSYGGGAKTKHVVGLHEYVLCYALSKEAIQSIELPPNPETLKYYKGRDALYEKRGPFRLQPLATKSMDARPNLRYPIPFEGEEIWPEKQWQWSRDRALAALANDELVIAKTRGRWSVNYKQYLRDTDGEERGAKPYSVIEGPYTQVGTGEVSDIFGDGKAFTFPKPTGLISHLLSFVVQKDKDALVLDFFAGSGTTAHAVMKLNAEDGGKRRFILVSSTEATTAEPDKNLCRDVCNKRVRRVIEGYGDNPGLGGDFAYLRCRRIAPGRLLDIEHEQVWTALQMIHRETLASSKGVSPLPEQGRDALATFLIASDEEALLVYVPRFTKALVPALREAVKDCAAVVIYSWQPETLRQHIRAGNVQHEAIPESLERRFGMKG